jgi:hypothetical protein
VEEQYRKFMTFDYNGRLIQMACIPFGWNASPWAFCTAMQVFTRRLRSPTAPTAAALKTAVKSELEPLWVGGRRVQCWSVTSDHEELRLLPYMDDFILFAPTRAKALQARARVQAVLDDLGLSRHPSKGQWDPTQRLDHLGICISLEKTAMFFVPVGRLEKIRKMAHALICRAKRNRRLLPAMAIAGFTGLVQSVYFAIPVAKLYLRSSHDMLRTCGLQHRRCETWSGGRRWSQNGTAARYIAAR